MLTLEERVTRLERDLLAFVIEVSTVVAIINAREHIDYSNRPFHIWDEPEKRLIAICKRIKEYTLNGSTGSYSFSFGGRAMSSGETYTITNTHVIDHGA